MGVRTCGDGSRPRPPPRGGNLTTQAEHLTLSAPPSWVRRYSPDSKRLVAFAGNHAIAIRDAMTGAALVTITGHTVDDLLADFSPDGKSLVSAGYNELARTWDSQSGKSRFDLPGQGVTNARFSPDGDLIVTSHDGPSAKARRWRAVDGSPIREFVVPGEWCNCAVTTVDRRFVVACSQSGVLYVYDAESGQLVRTLFGHTSNNLRLELSPDGTRLLTSDFNGRLQVLALDLDDLATLARRRLTRTLTADECQQYLHVEVCPPTE